MNIEIFIYVLIEISIIKKIRQYGAKKILIRYTDQFKQKI